MIIAIEGADGVGKSTLWERLYDMLPRKIPARFRRVRFVSYPPLGSLWQMIEHVEAREAAVFDQLYDPGALYLMDRFFAVSGPVYATAFQRTIPDYRKWLPELVTIHLSCPLSELQKRIAARGDDQVEVIARLPAVVDAYESVLSQFEYTVCVLDATQPLEFLTQVVVARVQSWTALMQR